MPSTYVSSGGYTNTRSTRTSLTPSTTVRTGSRKPYKWADKKSMSSSASGRSKNKTTLVQFVKNVVNRENETKFAFYYSSGTGGLTAPGDYANWAYLARNQFISTNATDILRIIPPIANGTGDNQRIGDTIRPKSLKIHGSVKCNMLSAGPLIQPIEICVVVYVLQHVTYKSYASLAGNDFSQLLETGENSTVPFTGTVLQSQLPVCKDYYKLLKKKLIRLRYGGANSPAGVLTGSVSPSNSHDWQKNFSINVSKHLPAKFMYPEASATVGINDPTNSSIFMCTAFYNMDNSTSTQELLSYQVQYHSELYYKDS